MPQKHIHMDTQTPEEIAAEQAAAVLPKEEELRAKVIEEFGFDETNDAERIDKLVTKEMENSKKLSKAIEQKIKWRTEASKPKDITVTPTLPKTEAVDTTKQIEEILAKRDLADMSYPDEIKKEISDWAKFKGISVKQAASAPHIALRIEAAEKDAKADEATISRTNRSSGKKTYSFDDPPALDTSSNEAFQKSQTEYKAWQDAMKKAGH